MRFIVSSFYHNPFKSYVPDYNPTTDIKYRFRTRGPFENQVTIFSLHAIESRNCINIFAYVSIYFMKFDDENTKF